MAILFNSDFIELDTNTLLESLALSPLSSTVAEDMIHEAIESSMFRQEEILSKAHTYYENILKHSNKSISTRRDRALLENTVPTISSIGVEINIGDNTELVSGLLKRTSLRSSYSRFFWSFGGVVMLQNDNYSILGLSGANDILASTEMRDYYFLTKAYGQTLYRCMVAIIGQTLPFGDIRTDRVLSNADMGRIYFKKSDVLNITSKNLYTGVFSISANSISGINVYVYNGTIVSRLFSRSGTVTYGESKVDFIPFSAPFLDDSAALEYVSSTNAKSIIDSSIELGTKKAPFINWEPVDLKKTDEKSTEFKEGFVSLLLSGNSISKENMEEHKSLVAKKELDSILLILADEIVNMDICNDN